MNAFKQLQVLATSAQDSCKNGDLCFGIVGEGLHACEA